MEAAWPLAAARRISPRAGDALAFRLDKLDFLLRSAHEAGVVELRLGRPRTYLLSDPADIRHVLVMEEPRFTKNPRLVEAAEPALFGEGLVGSQEAEHRSKRLSLQPAFDHRKLGGFADSIVACADELLDEWTARGELDAAEASIALAHRVRMRVLLGSRAGGIARELAGALETRQRYIRQAFVSPLPRADRLPTRARRAYRRAQDTLERLLLPLIAERRRNGAGEPDLLAHLLELGDDDGAPLVDRRVFDEARGFLASHELSARGLAWALLLLAEHGDVQARLAHEAAESPRDVLGYAQLVYSETLRLYPPTWLFVRMAPEDVVLPGGHPIPAGSRLFLCPYTSHRDPRHFPDPERFDPERFRPGPATRARPRSAYFPFGGGRHVCIGEGFVRLEAALVLARIASRVELTRPPQRPVVPFPGASLEPRGGVRLRLRGR